MNNYNLDHMISVIQAAKEGKTIQSMMKQEFSQTSIAHKLFNEWSDCTNPTWNWDVFYYRVKPEEK